MPAQQLSATERETWMLFHGLAYKDDLDTAKLFLIKKPRWSIISGYYAMHNIAKFYLGKIHGIKVSGEHVHTEAVQALRSAMSETPEKERIIELLSSAEEFSEIATYRHKAPSILLNIGRKERKKTQYYNPDFQREEFSLSYAKTASYFLDSIVTPFIKMMEALANAP